ncbi:hypothetical protein ACS0TY_032454 [Phlomoides rotata]
MFSSFFFTPLASSMLIYLSALFKNTSNVLGGWLVKGLKKSSSYRPWAGAFTFTSLVIVGTSRPAVLNLDAQGSGLGILIECKQPCCGSMEKFISITKQPHYPIKRRKLDVMLPSPQMFPTPPVNPLTVYDVNASRACTIMKARVLESMWIKHYSSRHKILLVGEGDFSFSASLARAFGNASNMVATSLDTEADLEIKHPSAAANVVLLKEKGCSVMHGVNASTIRYHHLLSHRKFDRIVFNFPHSGFLTSEHSSLQIM